MGCSPLVPKFTHFHQEGHQVVNEFCYFGKRNSAKFNKARNQSIALFFVQEREVVRALGLPESSECLDNSFRHVR